MELGASRLLITNRTSISTPTDYRKILKISVIIILCLLCIPYNWISKNNKIAQEQSNIMDNIKYILLKYGAIGWSVYITIVGIMAYYEPGIAVLLVLFFVMVFTWDVVGQAIDPCLVDKRNCMGEDSNWKILES